MKRDILQNQYHTTGLFRMLFADLICFLVVAIGSLSFCYAYFSDTVDVVGDVTMAFVDIEYRSDPSESTELTTISAQITSNGVTKPVDANAKILPGDTLTITGYATNTSNVNVYALAKLEIVNKDEQTNTIDTETLFYTIGQTNGEHTLLYVERGLFQVGATLMEKQTSKQLAIDYTFEGERYNNNYANISITFSLLSCQADYLNLALDYNEYKYKTDASTDSSIYASHYITGRKRDVYESSDKDNLSTITIDELEHSNSTYYINSCRDWMIITQTSTSANNYHRGKTFKLNAYLDFAEDTTSKTISRLDANIDGQGYTISNWNASGSMITNMYGNITNLGLDSVYISASRSSNGEDGVMVAHLYYKTISNCFVIGKSNYDATIDYDIDITTTSNVSFSCGGIVGKIGGDNSSVFGKIEDCYVLANIRHTGSGSGIYIGGITGYAYSQPCEVNRCYYQGNIVGGNSVGMIAGNMCLNSDIQNCFGISQQVGNVTENCIQGGSANIINCAYILGNIATSDVVKQGSNTTDVNLVVSSLKSIGVLHKAFGWDTSVWGSNIYQADKFPILRVFYNY